MDWWNVRETAQVWGVSERSVRNYCAEGRVPGAVRHGKEWQIPADAEKPERLNKRQTLPNTLPERLKFEKDAGIKGGIYHHVQVQLTYNSNHIEGSRLSEDQTRLIFETNTLGGSQVFVDDVLETANHFLCVDKVIDSYNRPLSEAFIKDLHRTLKNGTTDSRQDWFAVGEYKRIANEVGGKETTPPELVPGEMKALLQNYAALPNIGWDDIIRFHHDFEAIHPFQDGNGRIGRLILFKECLRAGIVPFIIADREKFLYYNGLAKWEESHEYLSETCRLMQDDFRAVLSYFGLKEGA